LLIGEVKERRVASNMPAPDPPQAADTPATIGAPTVTTVPAMAPPIEFIRQYTDYYSAEQ
jgi:hypothetical protein